MKLARIIMAAVATLAFALTTIPDVRAEINNAQHLNNRGQQKVSNVKAKRWLQDGGSKDGYSKQQDNTIVNFGSKKAGTCNMNIGSSDGSGKAPKDVVITTQNIINLCK
ncbi:MAG: hypothetical protein ACM3Q1_18425 [Bacteroidales bacterium]